MLAHEGTVGWSKIQCSTGNEVQLSKSEEIIVFNIRREGGGPMQQEGIMIIREARQQNESKENM